MRVRPLLKTGLRRMWRAGGSLQVGVTPGRSLLLNGLSDAAERFLAALDGSRDIPELLGYAQQLGFSGAQAATLLDVLARAGFLDDAAYDPGLLRELDVVERDRLRPDLASLALGFLVPGGAVRAMGRRRSAVVAVHGCGRVGASVANILAAAGVGCVVPVDGGRVRVTDAAPAGYPVTAAQERQAPDAPVPAPRGSTGTANPTADRPASPTANPTLQSTAHPTARKRQEAVRDLIRGTAAGVRTALPANRQHPDVAVLAPTGDAHPALAESLRSAGVPHLVAEIHETTAVLGPFVQPGRTSCLTCRDMYRTASDPGWPRALAPFGGVDAAPGRDGERPCDVVLATQLAVSAAMHVLSFIEGDPPPSAGSSIEITLPDGAQTRLESPAHPDCGCGAAEAPSGSIGERSPARWA
jgi:hypothetical protein